MAEPQYAETVQRWAVIGSRLRTMAEPQYAETVQRWAVIGSRLRTKGDSRLQLGKIHRLAEIGAMYLSQQRLRLNRILAHSTHRFAPIGEPLTINFGLNRWLIAEREEAYSDWLAWIFDEIGTNHLLTLLFEQSPPHEFDGKPTVTREECVPEGHIGHSGRLDIVLRFVNAVIVIEVKTSQATNIEKHQGYRRWLKNQPERIKLAFLIAVGNIVDKHGGFAPLSWDTLCVRMRQIFPRLIQEQRIILAAIVGAFVGAVEQNVLGYLALRSDGPLPFGGDIDRVVTYLEKMDG